MWGGRGRSIVTEGWRYNAYQKNKKGKARRPPELFDKQNDRGEFINLAQDAKYAATVVELSALLQGGWQACLP